MARAAVDRLADSLDTCATDQGRKGTLVDGAARVAVQIDLQKHGAIWEDFWDGVVSETRRKEKAIPYDQYRALVETALLQTILHQVTQIFPVSDSAANRKSCCSMRDARSDVKQDAIRLMTRRDNAMACRI